MRHRLVPARFLLVSVSLALACNAASRDPEVAANAAKSAGGAIQPLTVEPGKKGPSTQPGPGAPGGPGGPGETNPNPLPPEKTATCIVDDGDADTPTAPPDRTPPKAPNLPNPPIDRDDPEVEGPVPDSKSADLTRPSGTARRSATVTPIDRLDATRPGYARECTSKMTSEACETLCKDENLTWDSTAGNAGTCSATSTSTSDAGLTTLTTECGCMCK